MLGGKISNQDEDEVELELEALENEVRGARPEEVSALPNVPSNKLPRLETEAAAVGGAEGEPQPTRIKQEERQAMLA